jgi:hypothetical protein
MIDRPKTGAKHVRKGGKRSLTFFEKSLESCFDKGVSAGDNQPVDRHSGRGQLNEKGIQFSGQPAGHVMLFQRRLRSMRPL